MNNKEFAERANKNNETVYGDIISQYEKLIGLTINEKIDKFLTKTLDFVVEDILVLDLIEGNKKIKEFMNDNYNVVSSYYIRILNSRGFIASTHATGYDIKIYWGTK